MSKMTSLFCVLLVSLFRMFTFCQLKLCQARHRSWILIMLCEIRPNWFAERLTLAGDRGSKYDWLDLAGVYNNCIIMWEKAYFFFIDGHSTLTLTCKQQKIHYTTVLQFDWAVCLLISVIHNPPLKIIRKKRVRDADAKYVLFFFCKPQKDKSYEIWYDRQKRPTSGGEKNRCPISSGSFSLSLSLCLSVCLSTCIFNKHAHIDGAGQMEMRSNQDRC